jgi:hypothetical protein
MAVSRRLRFEVLRRDGYACRYCGATAPDVKLTVDHVNPSALGGDDRPENLVTACAGCNGGKSSIPPDAGIVANVAADALRWSAAMQQAADEALADIDQRDLARAEFDAAWSTWGAGAGAARKPIPRPVDWELSVDRFISAGLPMRILVDCVDKAMRNDKVQPDMTFRYMCGIAWKKVSELQSVARGRLTDGGRTRAGVQVEGSESMYRELVSSIFGGLWGPESDADVRTLAELQRKTRVEDEDPVILDADGLATVELVYRVADLICEAHIANQKLLAALPPEVVADLHAQAVGLNDWPEELESVARGVLYREYITARMVTFHLCPELRIEAWKHGGE